MEFKDLKEGMKLYQLVYWNNIFKTERQLSCLTIKKINEKSISFKEVAWRIKISELRGWFLTEKEAYRNALQLHKEEYLTANKEIKWLKKKIKEVES